MEQTKVKVSKTTLDSAIKALQDFSAANVSAYCAGKKLKRKERKRLWNNAFAYSVALEAEAEQYDDSKRYYFFDIVHICVNMTRTPYETAYKMLALLGIEVAE